MWTVSPPQALDAGAEPSKEQAAYETEDPPVEPVEIEESSRQAQGPEAE